MSTIESVAELTERIVIAEMFAACERSESCHDIPRWERAWTLVAGAYKMERRFHDAKRCEDNVVTLRALRQKYAVQAQRMEVAS